MSHFHDGFLWVNIFLCNVISKFSSQDDILPKLMSVSGSYEDLFKKEIAKYDRICEEIDKNVEAQEQLLLQIQVTRSVLPVATPIVIFAVYICSHSLTG